MTYLMRQSQGKLYFVGDGVGIASALNGLEGGGRSSTESCAGQTKGAHCEQEALKWICGRVLPIVKVACEKLLEAQLRLSICSRMPSNESVLNADLEWLRRATQPSSA